MDLIRLVDRLAAEDNRAVTFAGERCLHHLDRFQECRKCAEVCPAGAFTGEKKPAFAVESCVHCLACLPACPAGALVAADEVPDLFRFIRSQSPGRVELVCRHNPNAGRGTTEAETTIRVQGCLAGLGVGALLLLAAAGLERAVLRNDACAECAWSDLGSQVAQQVTRAQQWLRLWHKEKVVALSGPANHSWRERAVYSAGSPPVSRRDLFRLRMSPQNNGPDENIPTGNQPFHERLRLMEAYQQLGSPEPDAEFYPLFGLGLATVSLVSPTCNACGACARACPTGALNLDLDADAYALTFDGRACIGCDVCAHVCPLGIVEINHAPTFKQLFSDPAPVLLQSGPVATCLRCHARFPAENGEKYCPVCRFRLQNPFGAARPDDMLTEKQAGPGITS